MTKTQYIKYEGKFIPVYLLEKSITKELRAYLLGFEVVNPPEEFKGNTRLENLFYYGKAVHIEGNKKLFTRDGVHYQSKKPRPVSGFRFGKDFSEETSEVSLTTAHIGNWHVGMVPNWAWSSYSEREN